MQIWVKGYLSMNKGGGRPERFASQPFLVLEDYE